jgi:hypothetical protein
MAPVQTARKTGTPRTPGAVMRGLLAVAALFAGAADALVSAWLGLPRLGWVARRVGEAAASEYRRGAFNAIDAEIIDDPGSRPAAERQEGAPDGRYPEADTRA